MMSFVRQTKANGALIQFTTDVSERLLVTHCKTPFLRTSRQSHTYVDQIVNILNREETIRLFDLYLALRMASDSASAELIHTEHEEMTTIDPTLEFLQRVLPEEESTFHGPRPFRNHFQDPNGLTSTDGEIALHVTIRPDLSTLSVAQMQVLYRLPDLSSVVSHYINEASPGHSACMWDTQGTVSTWNKFRIQLHSSFRGQHIEKSQLVQAYPPSEEHPFGYCDAVLLRRGGGDRYGMIYGHSIIHPLTSSSSEVAQVRAVFTPKNKSMLPPCLAAAPLCYVRFFRVLPLSAGRPSVRLYQVERMVTPMGPVSGIVPLTDIDRPLDLVPVFDTALPGVVTSKETCMEGYARYYLNTFADKETFHVLHHQSQ
ncbi:hypothetical protein JVT61DRAFT_10595 [Boletus reticuloceps]|uniref:DUF6830 domain-containing protein n=1 Tax=Boletus reticuloceps TaxID=495285 RepID=A0A8I3A5I1_9AGAM|nr:hypothetical protein JVT61DRAFT_10595 [Boletus reticuloceps]